MNIKLPLQIFQGADFVRNFYYQNAASEPINITGYTARMEARQTTEAGAPVVFDISTSDFITVIGVQGLISILIPASATVDYDLLVDGVWDLFIYGPSNVPTTRLVGGVINITESVTRE